MSFINSYPMLGIELEEVSVPWAAAGSNVTLYLTLVDPIHLSIGNVLCPPTDLVPLASSFTARIILFDFQLPITSGAAVRVINESFIHILIIIKKVELFHHSRDVPATLSKLIAVLDRTTGAVVKKNPRYCLYMLCSVMRDSKFRVCISQGFNEVSFR